jgi:carbonic anhydrase
MRADGSTYSPKDDSLNAAMLIALQNFKVKHIVVTVSDRCRPAQRRLRTLADL